MELEIPIDLIFDAVITLKKIYIYINPIFKYPVTDLYGNKYFYIALLFDFLFESICVVYFLK